MSFSRRESPTQTKADAIQQVITGEIWGGVARGGLEPAVKAYVGTLNGKRGIEFTTLTAPEKNGSSPFEARWYLTRTKGVLLRKNAKGEDMACITANVCNLQP